MIFPRMCALAEVTWSPKSTTNWNDFVRRLQVHSKRLEQLGINYCLYAPAATETNSAR